MAKDNFETSGLDRTACTFPSQTPTARMKKGKGAGSWEMGVYVGVGQKWKLSKEAEELGWEKQVASWTGTVLWPPRLVSISGGEWSVCLCKSRRTVFRLHSMNPAGVEGWEGRTVKNKIGARCVGFANQATSFWLCVWQAGEVYKSW